MRILRILSIAVDLVLSCLLIPRAGDFALEMAAPPGCPIIFGAGRKTGPVREPNDIKFHSPLPVTYA